MPRKGQTVENLAVEAGLEVDEALLILWDGEVKGVEQPNDVIPQRLVSRARRVLGLGTRRELASLAHWQGALGLEKGEFERLLTELGIPVQTKKSLPKKMIVRLQVEVQGRRLYHTAKEDAWAEERATGSESEPASKPLEPLKWESIGHTREEMQVLSMDDLRAIHDTLVADFARADDPIEPPGVRSESLLGSALHRQTTSIGNTRKYPTIEMTGAALLHSLILNHPFHNGNKRTALVALLVFLEKNGVMVTCNENELFRYVLLVAKHKLVSNTRAVDLPDREVLEIADWIRKNSRLVEAGNRPVQWRKLRKILANYGCELGWANVGNRMNITRKSHDVGLLGKRKTITLSTQVAYSDEGRDADRTVVAKIRQDLRLDDEHGIDSRDFYEEKQNSVDDFIVTYRQILRRLSKL